MEKEKLNRNIALIIIITLCILILIGTIFFVNINNRKMVITAAVVKSVGNNYIIVESDDGDEYKLKINEAKEYDEGDIQNKLVKNFPGLHFFFKNVKKGYSARFVILKDGVETLIGTDKISRDSATGKFFVNPMLRTESAFSVTKIDSLEPTQDFLGWGTQNDRAHLVETYDKNWESILNEEPIHTWDELQLEPDNYDYIFYAIFEDHYWDINFYIVEDNGDLTKAYSTSVKHGTTLSDPGLLHKKN